MFIALFVSLAMETSKVISSSKPNGDTNAKTEKSTANALQSEPEKKVDSREESQLIPAADENICADIPPDFVAYRSVPDLNAYQQKKTLAQGMMDLALLSSNANQLRFILETKKNHPYYYASLTFIGASIVFQIAVAFGLILNGKYNIKRDNQIDKANRVNNLTIIGIFIVTVINVFVSAFSAAGPAPKDSD